MCLGTLDMLKMQDWDGSPAEIVHIYIYSIYIILNITFLCMIGESSASSHDMGRQVRVLASKFSRNWIACSK
jgi:hypothetical protein